MSGKEAMMEGMAAGRQDSRPKKADAPAVSGREAQNDAVARRIQQADADIQSFSDALWLEDGLSKNTLQAYRRDLAQLARWLAPSLGLSDMIIMLVGLAAFIGHLYPVFHGFKGGKGVATAGGVLLALNPLHGLAVLATWLAVAFLTRYSSLAAITAAFMAPIYWQLFYGIDARALVILFIAALLVWRHRENINRLLKGKESKIGGNKAPKPPKVKYPPPRVGGH